MCVQNSAGMLFICILLMIELLYQVKKLDKVLHLWSSRSVSVVLIRTYSMRMRGARPPSPQLPPNVSVAFTGGTLPFTSTYF
jgi:hypothetical protein